MAFVQDPDGYKIELIQRSIHRAGCSQRRGMRPPGCIRKGRPGIERPSRQTSRVGPPCQALPFARSREWWLGRDSNPRPRHYECRALTS